MQTYPTTVRAYIREMRAIGYSFNNALQSLEFIKGKSMLMPDTVTQIARNKALELMEANSCPKE